MSPEEFHRKKLKEIGYKNEVIDKLIVRYQDNLTYDFAERYAQQRVNEVLDKAVDAIDNMELECYNNCAGKASDVVESLKLKNNESI